MSTLLRKVIVGAVLASSCVVVGASTQGAAATRDALQMFDRRISEYAALHRRAAASLPPLTPSADVKWLMHARANLSFAIIAARPNARQGDVFTTPVATAFRAVIREALANVDVEAMLWDLYEECEVPSRYGLQVNGGYPGWATHEMPIVLLDALPILPEGIVYRLVDRHLVIWDVDADLIVDVLPDALPGAGS